MTQEIIVIGIVSIAALIGIRFFLKSLSGKNKSCGGCASDCSGCSDIAARINSTDFSKGN
jgi:hypothetical protein